MTRQENAWPGPTVAVAHGEVAWVAAAAVDEALGGSSCRVVAVAVNQGGSCEVGVQEVAHRHQRVASPVEHLLEQPRLG